MRAQPSPPPPPKKKPPAASDSCNFLPRSPSPNLLSLPFEKTTHAIEKKGKKQDYALYDAARSYAPVFCTSSLSQDIIFCRRKDWLSDGSKTKPFLFFCKLIACLVPCRGRKPDRWRSWRQRRRCNADRGLSPPNPPAEIRLKFSL